MSRDKQKIEVGRSSDFEPGAMSVVFVGTREIGVVRLRNGEIRAVLNRCPHKGAPICRGRVVGLWDSTGPGTLSFDGSRDLLVCPWHGFEFDLDDGSEMYWRKPSRLRFYEVEEEGGSVFVTV